MHNFTLLNSFRTLLVKYRKAIIVALSAIFALIVVFIIYLRINRYIPLEMPVPSGIYPVGRLQYDWTDTSRIDPLADQGTPKRELVVWIWYPASVGLSAASEYLPDSWVQMRSADLGLGVLAEHYFGAIRTHSYDNVPIAKSESSFPLLIMQPGMGPGVSDYTILAENLASHGYIVVGINPTYSSNWTVFKDGRSISRSSLGSIADNESTAAIQDDANRILKVWTQDVEFVSQQLKLINSDPTSLLFNQLDTDHFGIWGHSFGGASAISICQHDPRCVAGADLDGSPWGDEPQIPLPRPFMFFSAANKSGCDQSCELMQQVFQNTQTGAAYFVTLTHSAHFNFSDLPVRQVPLLRPLFILAGYEGTIKPERALIITSTYLIAFFDQHIKGIPQEILQSPSPAIPEVIFTSH